MGAFSLGLRSIGGIVLMCATAGFIAGCSNNSGSPVAPIRGGTASATPVPSATPVASATPVHTATPTPTPTATPTGSATATPTPVAVNCTTPTTPITSAGGSVQAQGANLGEGFAAGAFSTTANVVLNAIPPADLPAPLARARVLHRNGTRSPLFTQGAGNTLIVAFCTSFGGATLNGSAQLSGGDGIVPSSIPVGTQLNIAIYQNSTWVDVGSATVDPLESFVSTIPTQSLPGVNQAGSYIVYEPAPGTNDVSVNLGFTLIADDGTAGTADGLQFVQVEDPNTGVAEPTPQTTYFPIPASADLDGEGLTPDAQYGAVVDGGNSVYFFSGIPQHAFTLSPSTVDITNYGGDGDSIVSLPGGDQAVASGNGAQLVVISGILEGAPVVSDTINNAGGTDDRDGLVISNDGKTMLSRGQSGIDIFAVAPVAAHAGSTGTGTTKFSFTLESTLATPNNGPVPFFEDGRDEMAISPADSSRAVIAGDNTDPEITLITGLPTSPVITNLKLRAPAVAHRRSGRRNNEPSSHRAPFAAVYPSGVNNIYAVAITPDGTTAYVSTDAGIITVTGVNTGNLAQSGTIYAPSVPTAGGSFLFTAASSLSVLPDGKYLVAVADSDGDVGAESTTNDTQQGDGVLLTIPIGAGHALGAPAGQLNQVVAPFNDQIVSH
jgi:hypothetical protein